MVLRLGASLQEYRRYADLCSNLADTTGDKVERAMLIHITERWRRLANHKAKMTASQEPEN
jgi:hypothetical protein